MPLKTRMLDRALIPFQSKALIGCLICGTLALAGLSGCQSGRGDLASDEMTLGTIGDAPAPIDSVSTRGLEVRLWVVDDTDWAALRLLREYTAIEPNPIKSQDIEAWADWGFRLVAMPIGDVDGFLGSLRSVQANNVQWLGEFGQWRAVVRAGALSTGHVRVGEGSEKIELGKPRMIVRSWVEPTLTQSDVIPMLRLDLGLQIESTKRRSDPRLLGIDRARMIDDAGPVIDELLMSIRLDGSHAIVLVGDAPGSSWDHLPDVSLIPEDRDADESADLQDAFGPGGRDERDLSIADDSVDDESKAPNAPRSDGRPIHEPSRPALKSLGELMLTSSGSRITRVNETRAMPKRVIVIFVPRVAGGWSLLGSSLSTRAFIEGQG